MSYKIETLDKDEILVVTYKGPTNYAIRTEALDEVITFFRNNQRFFNLLIDTRDMENLLSTSEEYLFGEKLANSEEIQKARVALLLKQVEKDNFVNMVATNRGYNQKKFVSIDEAMDWLNYKKST